MSTRAADVMGWIAYAVGTAASASDRITSVGLAIAGLVVVVGSAAIKLYRDVLGAKHEHHRQEMELRIAEANAMAQASHCRWAQVEHKAERDADSHTDAQDGS